MAEGIGDLLHGGVNPAGDGDPREDPFRKKDHLSAEKALRHHPHQDETSQLLRLDTFGEKADVGFSSKVKGGVVGAEEYAALQVFFFEEDFDV